MVSNDFYKLSSRIVWTFIIRPSHTLNILLFYTSWIHMENNYSHLDQLLCLHCKKYINAPNFQIHEVRCSLRSSRVRPQENEEPRRPVYNSRSGRIKENGSNQRSSTVKRKKIFIENSNEEQQRIPCSFCGYQQTFAQLDIHPNICPYGQKKCQYCDQPFPQGLMQEHQQLCPAKKQLHTQQSHIHQEQPEIIQSDEDQYEHPFHSFGNFRSLFDNSQSRSNGRMIVRQSDGRGGFIIREYFGNGRDLQPEFPEMQRGFAFDRNNQRNASPFQQFHQFFRMIEAMAAANQQQQGLTKQQMKKIERIRYKPDKNIKKEEKDLCTICYCQFQLNEKIVKLKCKHIYHEECIFKWLEKNAKCPVCKTPQTDRPIYRQQ